MPFETRHLLIRHFIVADTAGITKAQAEFPTLSVAPSRLVGQTGHRAPGSTNSQVEIQGRQESRRPPRDLEYAPLASPPDRGSASLLPTLVLAPLVRRGAVEANLTMRAVAEGLVLRGAAAAQGQHALILQRLAV